MVAGDRPSRRLLLSALPGEVRAAALEDGQLSDLIIQRADRPSHLGSLFLGRVLRIDRAQEAAFVELGLDRPGFLPFSEGGGKGLSEGDPVVVRVLREQAAGKGLRLTARLKAPPADLPARIAGQKPPVLLQSGDDPIERLFAAAPAQDSFKEVVVDESGLFSRLKQRLGAQSDRLTRYRGAASLFEAEGLEEQLETLLQPSVPLASGGSLLIEPVITLTAIDVNSGGLQGSGKAEDLALAVNRAAAQEIVRQIRLRCLSGLLVIDFLVQQSAANRKAVTQALRQGLADDSEPTRLIHMSPSGLLEMTRRRGRPALHEVLCEPIGGSGWIKDPVTLAYDALRQAPALAQANPGQAHTLRAGPRVLAALQGPLAAARKAVEVRIGQAMILAPGAAIPGQAATLTTSND